MISPLPNAKAKPTDQYMSAAIEKFVRTFAITVPTFFPRENPISRKAKTSLHEDHEDGGQDHPDRVDGHGLRQYAVAGRVQGVGGRHTFKRQHCHQGHQRPRGQPRTSHTSSSSGRHDGAESARRPLGILCPGVETSPPDFLHPGGHPTRGEPVAGIFGHVDNVQRRVRP
jgi:hypothetical protein